MLLNKMSKQVVYFFKFCGLLTICKYLNFAVLNFYTILFVSFKKNYTSQYTRCLRMQQRRMHWPRARMRSPKQPQSMSVKFIYSEKTPKFCKISTLLLSICTVDKSKVDILQKIFDLLRLYELYVSIQNLQCSK